MAEFFALFGIGTVIRVAVAKINAAPSVCKLRVQKQTYRLVRAMARNYVEPKRLTVRFLTVVSLGLTIIACSADALTLFVTCLFEAILLTWAATSGVILCALRIPFKLAIT